MTAPVRQAHEDSSRESPSPTGSGPTEGPRANEGRGQHRPRLEGRQLLAALYLAGPGLLLLIAFFAFPLAVVLGDSLGGERFLGNYRSLWESVLARRALRATFEMALTTTLVCLLVGYPVAYRLSLMSHTRARLLLLVLLFPTWTAVLARLYAWTILLGRRGPINDALADLGFIGAPLELVFNRGAAVVGLVHITLPYMVLVLYSVMLTADRSLIAAAQTLGAGPIAIFRRVLLPVTIHGVVAGSLLVFILALGNYVTPAVLGGPRDYTVAQEIVRLASAREWGEALALGAVLLATVLGLFIVFSRLFGLSRLFGASRI